MSTAPGAAATGAGGGSTPPPKLLGVTLPPLLSALAARPFTAQLPGIVAGLTGIAVVIGLAWDSGGYFAPSYLRAGAVTFGVLALLSLRRRPYRASVHALLALGALVGLAAWTGLSTAWSPAADAGVEDMQRTLLYVGLFGLGLVVAGSVRSAKLFVWAVLAAVTAIVAAGLVSRLYPAVIPSDSSAAAYRLGYPLSYWNALGALAAFGAVLGLGLAGDNRSPAVVRGGGVAAVVIAVSTAYLSLSRGAFLALAVGLLVLLAITPRRAAVLVAAVIAAGFSAIAIARLQSYAALTVDPLASPGQRAAGHSAGPQLLAIVLGAGVVQALVALLEGRVEREFKRGLRSLRPLMIPAIVAVSVAALIGYAAASSRIDDWTSNQTVKLGDTIRRQWKDFQRTSVYGEQGPARLTASLEGTRSGVYRVALDEFGAHVLAGGGAGSFQYEWYLHRRNGSDLKNAHSLYLETMGETGLIGILLLVGFIAALAYGAVRSRKRPVVVGRAPGAAVAAALCVWLVHAGVDWDWQVSAFTGVAMLLAAILFAEQRRSRAGQPEAVDAPTA